MLSNRLIVFLGRFALFFSIGFVLPWLGLSKPCGAYLRAVTSAVFSTTAGHPEIDAERLSARDTRIVIVNRALMGPDGSGPVRNLDVKTYTFVWWPLCLYTALVLAGSRSTWRNSWTITLGALALQGLLLLVLGFAIWNNSTEVQLVTLTPFWKSAAGAVEARWESFYVLAGPFLLWVLLGFRRADFVQDAPARR